MLKLLFSRRFTIVLGQLIKKDNNAKLFVTFQLFFKFTFTCLRTFVVYCGFKDTCESLQTKMLTNPGIGYFIQVNIVYCSIIYTVIYLFL